MKTVKVLLVGAGGYAKNYVQALLCMHDDAVVFSAVADPCLATSGLQQQFVEHGVAQYGFPCQAYTEHQFNLVIISSPIHTHYAYIVEALEHGCNVLCEKPVVLDERQLADLQRRQKESGLFIAVGFQQCFDRGLLALKQDVLSGMFGKPVRLKALRFMRRGDAYYQRNNWAGRIMVEGQPIYDSPVSNACAHQLQTMLFLLGASLTDSAGIRQVEGFRYRARPTLETYDAAALRITTTQEVPLLYYTGHCVQEKQVGPIGEFEFEKGRIVLDGDGFTAMFGDGTVKRYAEEGQNPTMHKLMDALSCTRDHEKPVCTVDGVASHTAVVLAAQQLPLIPCNARYDLIEGDGTYVVPALMERCLKAYEAWSLDDAR